MAQEKIIGVRVSEERHGQFDRAAKMAGKKISEWLRDLGVAAISAPQHPTLERRAEYFASGVAIVNPPTSFVLKEDLHEVEGELVAELEPTTNLESAIAVVNDHMRSVGLEVPEEVEEVETRPWLPEITKILSMEDGNEASEYLAGLLGRKKVPKQFVDLKTDKKALARFMDKNYPLGPK